MDHSEIVEMRTADAYMVAMQCVLAHYAEVVSMSEAGCDEATTLDVAYILEELNTQREIALKIEKHNKAGKPTESEG